MICGKPAVWLLSYFMEGITSTVCVEHLGTQIVEDLQVDAHREMAILPAPEGTTCQKESEE